MPYRPAALFRGFDFGALGAAGALGLLALGGCMEKDGLAARQPTGAVSQGPDCASCHAYPLKDTNHVFHLFEAESSKTVNGPVSCLDCHATAMASRPHVILDSVYLDSLGNEWSTVDLPGLEGAPSRDSLRLDRVDTLRQERPVPASRAGNMNLLAEYMTSLAHMNGKVDVVFHPRVSDTGAGGKWPGRMADFNPARETCSAVACHPGDAAAAAAGDASPHWRFAAPSKGLTQLEGGPGDVP